jgi:hypothetical protein
LESALQQANKQFRPGDCNLLVVVPDLRLPVFAKTWPSGSGDYRTWKPRFTRVGAALFLNDYVDEGNGGMEARHRALIVHNPCALIPVPRDLWASIPEFFRDAGRWRWSDVNDG